MQGVFDQLAFFGEDQPLAWRDDKSAQQLCERCQCINWEPTLLYLTVADEYSYYPRVPLYQFHPQVSEIRDAAHEGCHLCTLVLTCLLTMRYRYSVGVDALPDGLDKMSQSTRFEVSVEAMALSPPVRLNVGFSSEEGIQGWLHIDLHIVSALPNKLQKLTCTSPPSEIARAWLKDCLDHHDLCFGKDIPKLPTRVIKISEEKLRLEEPQGKHARYATLSYSIGGACLFKTTSQNVSQRREGFFIDDLPKTAQDAVWWTRQLGLDYLWSDSVCILQDNLTDWEIELGSMAEIYSEATVTIAATRAQTAAEGCLPSMNKLNMLPCYPAPGIVILPRYQRDYWIFLRGFLDSRAWCFQEVELSKRVLRVGGEEIAWQCRKCKRLESDPEEQKVHDIQNLITFFGSRALDAKFANKAPPFKLWYTLAKRFAQRDLSFPADRLPAFSGMAHRFQDILKATYLAGLWKEDIQCGLMWSMINPGRYAVYRAPSWSWVTIDGGYLTWSPWFYDTPLKEYVAEVLDIWVRVSGSNPYGRVTAGKLTIYGEIAPIPSFLFHDDSNSPQKHQEHLISWDRGLPGIGSCFLRLHMKACMVLAPVAGRISTYTRVGLLVTVTEQESTGRGAITVETLDGYDWESEVLSIL